MYRFDFPLFQRFLKIPGGGLLDFKCIGVDSKKSFFHPYLDFFYPPNLTYADHHLLC